MLRRQHGRRSWLEVLAADVRNGLGSRPKRLPAKYFYDARGSELFGEITRLDEYYQTRTERGILQRIAAPLVRRLRPTALVEFGSGSAEKTRVLLDAMEEAGTLEGYGPVDVSETALLESARRLIGRYPGLRVEGVIGDYEAPYPLPFEGARHLLVFLGSTIGNMSRPQAVAFLSTASRQMDRHDRFLIGFDLVKDVEVIEAAYNDRRGVTRAFNLNVLHVLNRELDADFDPTTFRHLAFYEPRESRVEMHLVSTREQVVRFRRLEMQVRFEEGETIRTEVSYKYTRESAGRLIGRAGLELERWETDPEGLFALGLARARD